MMGDWPREKYDLFNTAELAELYSKHQPPLHERVVEIVLSATEGRDLLLDIGCGSGSSTRPFCTHFARVVGVDYSPAQIDLARSLSQQISNLEYHQASVYELPVPNHSVDCIIGVMIAHFIDFQKFFEEAKRVLKPGGVLLFHGKSSPRVVEIERETEYKSENETKTTVSDLNRRIVDIKTKLFSGLFHDRTFFNPLKYTNIPSLYPEQEASRQEWTASSWFSVPQLADYMLSWSAAGKYCAKHGMKSTELRGKLVEMLRCGDEGIGRMRCESDRFTWCCFK